MIASKTVEDRMLERHNLSSGYGYSMKRSYPSISSENRIYEKPS